MIVVSLGRLCPSPSPLCSGSLNLYAYFAASCLDSTSRCIATVTSGVAPLVPGATASVVTLDVVSTPGIPAPFPALPSSGPVPVASASATPSFGSTRIYSTAAVGRIRFSGVPGANASGAAGAALSAALSSDLTSWARTTLAGSTFLLLDSPSVVLSAAANGSAVDAAVTIRVYNIQQVAAALAYALTSVLQAGPLQNATIGSTLARSYAGMARVDVSLPMGPFSAVPTNADGVIVGGGSPLPSPGASAQTVGSVAISLRIVGVSLAQLQAAQSLLSKFATAVAQALAAVLKSQLGIDVPPEMIVVQLSASTGRMLQGSAAAAVAVTATAPVPQSVPGLTSLYADATEAALQASPATALAPVIAVAQEAAPGSTISVQVTGASGSSSAPATPSPAAPPGGSNAGAIAGGVIGAIAACAIVAVVVMYARSRRSAGAAKRINADVEVVIQTSPLQAVRAT